MKKGFSIFMAFFFVTIFSFAESIKFANSCHDFANEACQQEMDNYGIMSSADEIEAYVWYYGVCSEVGRENTLDPICL